MLTRRTTLLLPWVLAACGGHEQREFEPVHYNYLEPLRLNVAAIRIEQRFVPSGVAPDVSQLDPFPPIAALRNLAADRLQALGPAGEAVFVILDAAIVRLKNTINANFAVELNIYTAPNQRVGYADASVTSTYTGDLDDLPGKLYDITKSLMERMNVEFEFQVRRSLHGWLLPGGAPTAPVQQRPLTVGPPSGATP